MQKKGMSLMRDVKKSEIEMSFGKKTYGRGEDYFLDGHVESGVKKGTMLYGTVMGTEHLPYRTRVEVTDEIWSECSCPVGNMCKHGVALLLKWVEDRTSFVDIDDLLASFQQKKKEELIDLLVLMLKNDPLLAIKLAFTEQISEKKVTCVDISKRLIEFFSRHQNYFSMSEYKVEFDNLKSIGDTYASENSPGEAVKIYLSLIKNGIELFEYGIDDSEGGLGDLIMECVEVTTGCIQKLTEDQKQELIPEIMEIMKLDDYELETETMLSEIATKENFGIIKDAILEWVQTLDVRVGSFQRIYMLDLLVDLYEKFGMDTEAIEAMKKIGLRDGNDYYRIAKIYIALGENDMAFTYVKKGLSVPGLMKYELCEFYFMLLANLMDEGVERVVDINEALSVALYVSSHPFEPDFFSDIKDVFEKIGKFELLISEIKKKCDDDAIIEILLFEHRIEELIDLALSSNKLNSISLMKIAHAAREEGNYEISLTLVHKALKGKYLTGDPLVAEMISFFVKESDIGVIEDVMNNLPLGVAKPFATALIDRNQKYAIKILREAVSEFDGEEVKDYMKILESQYAIELCQGWIEHAVNRSHYDDAVEMLSILKDDMEKEEWESYISVFKKNHYRKKNFWKKWVGYNACIKLCTIGFINRWYILDN
jgi:hypothetical protein